MGQVSNSIMEHLIDHVAEPITQLEEIMQKNLKYLDDHPEKLEVWEEEYCAQRPISSWLCRRCQLLRPSFHHYMNSQIMKEFLNKSQK